MRVIAGIYRGRKLECPEGLDIRPTTDRVKENIFNILSQKTPYSDFLDLFSGSGAIGIEALSRAAESVTFVEESSTSVSALKKNLKALNITEGYQLVQKDVFDALEDFENKRKFDIIFMDPPYHKGFYQKVLLKLAATDVLQEDGIIMVERHFEDPYDLLPENLELIKERKYGTIILSMFQKR